MRGADRRRAQREMNNPRIAITGGRGRLAPGLAGFLRESGWEVELLSREGGGGFRALVELTQPAHLAGFAAVLHLGWSSVPLVAEENPGIEEQEDLPFARAVVAAAKQCAAPPLLVFFSTAAVYGNTGDEPATEDAPCLPLGRYAAAKLAAEKIFAEAPRACVLRISNVFSPGCAKTRPQGIIPLLLESARIGRPVTIWGDGSTVKDYIAASDLHAAAAGVLRHGLCGIFNVVSGHALSVNELIRLVEQASGHRVPATRAPHYVWDVEKGIFSSQRLRSAAGWSPQVDPAQAIKEMAAAAR